MKNELRGHQGDVQFKSIGSIPANAKKVANKPIALGEHSGHMHVLTGDVQMFEIDGRIVCAVGSDGARLQHVHESNFTDASWTKTDELQKADHNSHLLPEGNYEFFIQNSYNPYSKLLEQVID
ncbi:hypothetical protein [Chitinophaga sp.]|uniref:hypothetical protein n=1 Tax=Chitinophaga sp. TaxID=1869181 RepID=UPI0031E075F4